MSSYRESVTPIFDEVDRRWRMAEDPDEAGREQGGESGRDVGGETPPSMLSFPGTPSRPAASLTVVPRREPGPRHALRR